MFLSRNKDNKWIPGFHQRTQTYLTNKDDITDYDMKNFEAFVNDGLRGEKCRLYISVNARDPQEVKKKILIDLIQNDEADLTHLESLAVSRAMRAECALEHKWMFDFDKNDFDMLLDFISDMKSLCGYGDGINYYKTPNGFAVIVEHGFDCRKLLDKYSEIVELKRDSLLCISWCCTGDNYFSKENDYE